MSSTNVLLRWPVTDLYYCQRVWDTLKLIISSPAAAGFWMLKLLSVEQRSLARVIIMYMLTSAFLTGSVAQGDYHFFLVIVHAVAAAQCTRACF